MVSFHQIETPQHRPHPQGFFNIIFIWRNDERALLPSFVPHHPVPRNIPGGWGRSVKENK